jgi:hypothetical protein
MRLFVFWAQGAVSRRDQHFVCGLPLRAPMQARDREK